MSQVVVRVRPRNAREQAANDAEVVRIEEDNPHFLLVCAASWLGSKHAPAPRPFTPFSYWSPLETALQAHPSASKGGTTSHADFES